MRKIKIGRKFIGDGEPTYSLPDGLAELVEWANTQSLEAPKC